jgi:hypothetical protein
MKTDGTKVEKGLELDGIFSIYFHPYLSDRDRGGSSTRTARARVTPTTVENIEPLLNPQYKSL